METLRTLGPATFVLCMICCSLAMPHMNGIFHKNKFKDDELYKNYRERPKYLGEGGKEFDSSKLNSCESKDDGSYDIFTGRGPFVMKKNVKGDGDKVKCDRGFLEKMRDGFAPYDCYCAIKDAGTN